MESFQSMCAAEDIDISKGERILNRVLEKEGIIEKDFNVVKIFDAKVLSEQLKARCAREQKSNAEMNFLAGAIKRYSEGFLVGVNVLAKHSDSDFSILKGGYGKSVAEAVKSVLAERGLSDTWKAEVLHEIIAYG